MTNTHTERYRRGQAAAVGRVIAGLDALARELAGIEDADDLEAAAAGESAEHDLERITGSIGRTRRGRAR